jgi:hypothetical protein
MTSIALPTIPLPVRSVPDPSWVELLGVSQGPPPRRDPSFAVDVLGAAAVFVGFLLAVALLTAVMVVVVGGW